MIFNHSYSNSRLTSTVFLFLSMTFYSLLPLAENNDKISPQIKKLLLQGKTEQAVRELSPLAKSGNDQARYQLAILLLNNASVQRIKGQKESLQEAENLLLAASQNSSDAAFLLGSLYYKGKQVERQMIKAKQFLSIAAKAGNQRAEKLLRELEFSGASSERIKPQTQRLFELALSSGNLSLVIKQFLSGANLNYPNSKGNPPLHTSIILNRSNVTQWLLKQDVDLLNTDKQGNTALHLAAKLGQMANVILLEKQLKKVDVLNLRSQTPLILAIKSGHPTIAQWLVNKGADINRKDENGFSAIEYSEKAKLTLTVKTSTEQRIKSNTNLADKQYQHTISSLKRQAKNESGPYYQWPILAIAVAQAQVDIAKRLLTQGHSPWQKISESNSATSISLQADNTELTFVILRNFPLSSQNNAALIERLFLVAVEKDNIEIMEKSLTRLNELGHQRVLIKGLKNSINEGNKVTVQRLLDISTIKLPGQLLRDSIDLPDPEITKLLLAQGIEVNHQDNHGTTALMQASQVGNYSAIELLLKHNVDVNLKDNRGVTALVWAIKKDCLLCVELLMKSGASSLQKSNNGNNAVMIAAQSSNRILKYLLQSNIDLSIRNNQSFTALMLAVSSNCIECVGTLLSKGANPRRKNANGQDSFDLALNNEELLVLLDQ